MRPTLPSKSCALLVLALSLATSALAQSEVSSDRPEATASADRPIGEYWALRLRYGLAFRNGLQNDSGPGLTYGGFTPNDLSFGGWAWLGYVGLHAQVQREAFGLFGTGSGPAVTAGGLIRFNAQLAGRLPVGPLRIEPYVGYGLHQLPAFRGDGTGSTLAPVFGPATRHSFLAALRVLLEVWRLQFELRGELPVALATSIPGAPARAASNGFSAGGGVRLQVAEIGKAHFGILAEASYVADDMVGKDSAGGDVIYSRQRLTRAGVALDLQWRDPPPEGPTSGGLIVRVVDSKDATALPGAEVSVTSGGQERPLTPDAQGALALRGLRAGPYTLRVTAEGYLPFESAGAVTVGVDTPVEVRLQKEPPKVGGIQLLVQELDTNKPLPGATVKLGDLERKSDDKGRVTFAGLKAGAAALAIQLEGYQKGEEAVSVVAGKTIDVAITLVPEKKRVPATINGLVRSIKGGAPIAADLEIPQVKQKTKADAKGAFTFRLEGGSYTVKISAPGYLPQTKEVTVKDGDQAIFNVDLHPR